LIQKETDKTRKKKKSKIKEMSAVLEIPDESLGNPTVVVRTILKQISQKVT
jgi:hypothetical protein